jgi:hypothetical protein
MKNFTAAFSGEEIVPVSHTDVGGEGILMPKAHPPAFAPCRRGLPGLLLSAAAAEPGRAAVRCPLSLRVALWPGAQLCALR